MAEEYQAGNPFEARVGIGKVASDISQRRGAEQGVTYGVTQGIRIGVSLETLLKWDLNPSEHKSSSCNQTVIVDSVPYTHGRAPRLFVHGTLACNQ